ncbi:DoxX family protein [Psychromicrobium sp. YIM B11713]|uniref:DoxX family protein n=1 Tax=Psychromicrobium sp. YIM B11713 TaxID=3145233 RepID=UPI00374ECCF9
MTQHPTVSSTQRIGKGARIAGWIVTGLVTLFLAFDGVTHLLNPAVVQESMKQLGYPEGLALPIGIVELVILALTLIPRTAILGAILMTGYLGGAVTSQLRVEAPLFSTVLFAVYVGIGLWLGLWLRDVRVRRLL